MSLVIALPCVKTKDTACVQECPVDAIHPTKDEPGFAEVEQLFIDPDACICCSLCKDACPVKAIYPEEELPAEWAEYKAINAAYYSKK